MSIDKARRSLVFHLWARLMAITAVFTLIALAVFVWMEIGDNLDTARAHAHAQAEAASKSVTNRLKNPPRGPAQATTTEPTSESLGIRGMQLLNSDGSVVATFGGLDEEAASIPEVALEGPRAYDVRISGEGFVPTRLKPLDLLMGGRYGLADVVDTPVSSGAVPQIVPPYTRVILEYDNISGTAQTLLLRSMALAGGILAVAALTIWALLNHFVARPLNAYNRAAQRIAAGERALMPDLGTYEFAELGQTIDDMAAALRHQAAIDGLTGLYNVRHLRTMLPTLLDDARRREESLAVVVCDLDNMKPVNDTFGHHAGDLMLQTVAETMKEWATEKGTCWRTGGDEFVAALPNTEPEIAVEMGRELQRRVQAAGVDLPKGLIAIRLSFGVSAYPHDGESVDGLLNAADRRMYEWKARKKSDALAGAA